MNTGQIIDGALLSAVLSLLACPAGWCEEQATGAVAAHHGSPRHRSGYTLEDRVKLLTKALDLDATQKVAVRELLQTQREEVLKLWDDTTIPSGSRVAATQAISDRTAGGIRALLNEEQKKKFSPPKPARDPQAETGKRSVEDWMHATQPKQ